MSKKAKSAPRIRENSLASAPEMKPEIKVPRHIAIIMDGNGRWAKAHGKKRISGHREGVKATRDIVEVCGELGVKYLTLYTFSTENWNRSKAEVTALMKLLVVTIGREAASLDRNNVRLSVIGWLDDLDDGPREAMEKAINRLSGNDGLHLILALSYGGRRELLASTNRRPADGKPPVRAGPVPRGLYSGARSPAAG